MGVIRTFLLLLLTSYVSFLYGQQDSIATIFVKKLRIGAPAVETFGINLIVNRTDLWLFGFDWTDVNLKTWKTNLSLGLKSDADRFSTNFFSHPMHGSLYFNTARSNGHSYWTSIPYVMGGSLMWEFFGETEAASEIDFNTTSLGGIFLGEVTYRLAHLLTRNDKNRKYRWLRNGCATVLNPITQFNRWIYGSEIDHWQNASTNTAGKLVSYFYLGQDFPFSKVDNQLVNGRLHASYSMVYGDLFKNESYQPFDFFTLKSWLDLSLVNAENPIYINITSHAPVWRYQSSSNSIFAASQHYDFIHNDVFKLAAMSVTTDYTYKDENHISQIIASVKPGLVLFGSTSSDVAQYLIEKEVLTGKRDYLYGRGLALELFLSAKIAPLGRINFSYNNWYIYIRRDAVGSEMSQIFKLDYNLPIYGNHSLGFELYQYRRKADFTYLTEFKNVRKRYLELKVFAAYKFH